MAEFVETLLAPGETITLNARQHWVALIRFALQPILILIASIVGVGLWLATTGDGFLVEIIHWLLGVASLLGFVIAIVWLPIQAYRWMGRRFVLTSRRIIRSDGVLRRSTIDAGLDKITDVAYRQTMLGQRMGYGDITVVTAAGAPIRMQELIGANEFKKAIMEQQEALIRERAGSLLAASGVVPPGVADALAGTAAALASAPPVAPAPPAVATQAVPAAPAPPDERASTADEITATLVQLADMRDAGTITEADFEAKKAELLERL